MIVSICIVAALGVVLIFHTQGAKDKMKDTISLSSLTESGGQISETLSFENLALAPGNSTSYEVKFINVMSGSYVFKLEFNETYDGGLSSFVDVEIAIDGTDLKEDVTLLSTYFGTNTTQKKVIDEEIELKENQEVVLKITYSMDESVGDDESTKGASGASTKFDLKLIVEKA
jgi:hypothetical protein